MTRLIVISSEGDLKNEAELISDLFSEGMELFHLRKPQWSKEQQFSFLEKLNPSFMNKVSVHQHYDCMEAFDLRYCHIKENNRLQFTERKKGIAYSTSFHEYGRLQSESHHWNYCFLSPLFNSISKYGYKSVFSEDFKIDGDLYQRVYALGGINNENIDKVFEKEFYGAAVLGAIWSDPSKSIHVFKELNKKCRQNVHTF